MQDKSDAQVLRDYAEHGNEAAFHELATRHTDLIYSTALRLVHSPDLAGDVVQSVFTDLARKARSLAEKLPEEGSLVGWFHRATRFAALSLLRNTRRRQENERQAMEQLLTNSESSPDWESIRPALDEALDNLCDEDREALLLRYFKNRDFRAVGRALGVSDDAAQKRVTRAVESMREFFVKNSITVSASGLVVVISANAVQAAPVGLAGTASTAAIALAGSAIPIAIKAIAMSTLQKTLITVTLAAAVSAGIYETRQISQLRAQNRMLQKQQAPLSEQVQKLQQEGESAAQQIVVLREDNERLNRNTRELAKLRSEVTQLRKDAQELAKLKADINGDQPAAEAWRARVNLLKERLERFPEAKIPELRLINDYDWLQAARGELKTEIDYRKALSQLRSAGEGMFARGTEKALQKYLKANDNKFPTELTQLIPYNSPYQMPPIDDTMLQRWHIVSATNKDIFGGDWVITQKAPVDEDYDARLWIGPTGSSQDGMGSFKFPQVTEVMANTNIVRGTSIDPNDALALLPVMRAYAAANNGQQATNESQLTPYLTTSEQKSALLRLGGEMGLVGVGLAQGNNNLLKVSGVLPGLPAEKAGVKAGSLIISIDGVNVAGKSLAEVRGMIQGRAGTDVTLELADPKMTRTNKIRLNRIKQ